MAGASIDVGKPDKWFLDVGYRYHDAGEFKKDAGAQLSGPAFPTGGAKGDLEAHELMIGFRREM